ncbi:hypothetical protein ADIS_3209 [Lunatimonas lonarensis]|uniref:Uncharacterized protein n=1 Tax=Lunatimonas lonarensis TaxID=1232681 RepID=R7ZPP6_9BACT|nr:hypothetical protein ADIS_3209 [Lunatimonas lonarensis]
MTTRFILAKIIKTLLECVTFLGKEFQELGKRRMVTLNSLRQPLIQGLMPVVGVI